MLLRTKSFLKLVVVVFVCSGTLLCMSGEETHRRRSLSNLGVLTAAPDTVAPDVQHVVYVADVRQDMQQNDVARPPYEPRSDQLDVFCCCEPDQCCMYAGTAAFVGALAVLKYALGTIAN